jgi:hypothetical protein
VLSSRDVVYNDLDRASVEHQNKATPISLHQQMRIYRMGSGHAEGEQRPAFVGL